MCFGNQVGQFYIKTQMWYNGEKGKAMKIKRIRHIRKAPVCKVDFSELKNLLDTIFEDAGLRFNDETAMTKKVSDDSGRFTVPDKEDIARTIPHGYVKVEGIEDAPRPTIVEPSKNKVPPSIFDIQCDGKYEDLFKQLFPSAIVNGKRNQEVNNPPAKNDPDEMPLKDAFVFIANRLTFLVKTRYPIIWDTSTMETIGDDIAFIALDEEKNPQIDLKNATEIAMAVNDDEMIQNEIEDYFKDTKWKSIYCAPFNMDVKGKCRLGFVFYVRLREDD